MSRNTDGEQHYYLNDDAGTEVFFDAETSKFYKNGQNSREYIETVTAPVLAKINLTQNSIVFSMFLNITLIEQSPKLICM